MKTPNKPKKPRLTGKSQLWNDPAAKELSRLAQAGQYKVMQAKLRQRTMATEKKTP
jgi:hypothetical protein